MSQNKLPTQYQAMAVTQFGGPQVLKLTTREMPILDSGEVLVKTIAASINPIDYKTRAGLGWAAEYNKDNLPFVLGYDCFGEVVAVADNTSSLTVGDKVIGLVGFPRQAGAYGEYVATPASAVVKVSYLQSRELAALPVAGITAAQGLFEFGQLKALQTVLISGAAGAVGYLAVQLALREGAKVIAVANAKDHKMLSALGPMTLIDYNQLDDFSTVGAIDLWFDLIGGDKACAQLAQVATVRRLVTVPSITAPAVIDAVVVKGTHAQGMLITQDTNRLKKLALMVEKGELKLNIAKYMNFDQAALAHHQLENGQVKGKIVLEFL